jgi:hypothetical protein
VHEPIQAPQEEGEHTEEPHEWPDDADVAGQAIQAEEAREPAGARHVERGELDEAEGDGRQDVERQVPEEPAEAVPRDEDQPHENLGQEDPADAHVDPDERPEHVRRRMGDALVDEQPHHEQDQEEDQVLRERDGAAPEDPLEPPLQAELLLLGPEPATHPPQAVNALRTLRLAGQLVPEGQHALDAPPGMPQRSTRLARRQLRGEDARLVGGLRRELGQRLAQARGPLGVGRPHLVLEAAPERLLGLLRRPGQVPRVLAVREGGRQPGGLVDEDVRDGDAPPRDPRRRPRSPPREGGRPAGGAAAGSGPGPPRARRLPPPRAPAPPPD